MEHKRTQIHRVYEGDTLVSERAVENVVIKTTCDLCEAEIDGGRGWDDTRVEIRANDLKRYPEGAQGEWWRADVCPWCFRNKVIPALEALGIKRTWEDYPYPL